MKQYQCLITCYASLYGSKGKHLFHEAGSITETDDDFELPEDLKGKFVCLTDPEETKTEDDDSINYGIATKEQLMSVSLKFDDLKEYCSEELKYELVKGNKKKEELVDEVLEAREEFNLNSSNPNSKPS